jgi:hypothetical protein
MEPSQEPLQTVVVSPVETQPKKVNSVVIGLTVFIIFCVIGFGLFYYFPNLLNIFQKNINSTNISTSGEVKNIVATTTEETSGWASSSLLVDSNVGYSIKDNQLFFKDRNIGLHGYDLITNPLNVWAFDNALVYPVYGFEKLDNTFVFYVFGKDGLIDNNLSADFPTFKVYKNIIEDNSCGYICKYNASDKNHRYLNGHTLSSLPSNADQKTFSVIYNPDGSDSTYAKDGKYLYEDTWGNEYSTSSLNGVNIASFVSLGGGYFKDKNKIYYDSYDYRDVRLAEVPEADLQSFQYDSNLGLGKDSTHIFSGTEIVTGADINTFVSVDKENFYFKDKNHVFEYSYRGYIPILKDTDLNTFVYDEVTRIAKDKNHIWVKVHDDKGRLTSVLIPNSDPKTFSVIYNPDGSDSSYAKDGKYIYDYNWDYDNSIASYSTTSIDGVDIPSFVSLGGGYFKDKNKIYYDSYDFRDVGLAEVPDTDLQSFRYDSNLGFGKDNKHVFNGREIFVGIDVNTFVVVSHNGFYKDKNYVYNVSGEGGIKVFFSKLKNADPSTFEYDKEKNIAKDKNYVWISDTENGAYAEQVLGVDPKTFTLIKGNHYRDNSTGISFNSYYMDSKAVYYNGSVVKVLTSDISKFHILGTKYNDYSADSTFVYFNGTKVIDVDLQTFTYFDSDPISCGTNCTYDAQDKSHKYLNGKIVQ